MYFKGEVGNPITSGHINRIWGINKTNSNVGLRVDFKFWWNVDEEEGDMSEPTLNHYNTATGEWKIAAGNKQLENHYSFIDVVPDVTNYYCLKCVGVNGSVIYSNVRFIQLVKSDNELKVCPNPSVNGKFRIISESNKSYIVTDINGKILRQGVFNNQENRIDLDGVQNSVYFHIRKDCEIIKTIESSNNVI